MVTHDDKPARRRLALAVLCVSLLIVTLDNTILNVALPTLVRDLHATSSELQWIVDAYIMVFAGLLLVAGSAGDRFGRKRVFLAGLLLFTAGSAWSAWSGSVDVLIAARASMGVGGAMIMPSTLSIITDMFRDPFERRRAIGLWSATSGLGIALGPIAGGLLLARFWWGSVFLVNVPIALLGLACAVPLIPESRDPVARRPDPVGALLSTAGLGAVLWAIIEAPTRGWGSAAVTGVGLGGLAVLGAFVLWERVTDHPMLSLWFFRDRRFTAAASSVGLCMFALFGTLFVLTQFLQFALGYSAIQAGLRILPVAAVLAVVAPASTALVRVAGTKLSVTAGLLTIAGGLWQLSTTSAASTYPDVLAGMLLLGVGAGLVIPASTDSVMGSLPPARAGIGSATNGVFLQVGGALGVAVIGSLLSTRYQDHMTAGLAPHPVPHAVLGTLLGSIGGALGVAQRLGGAPGAALAHLAHSAFASGMDLGLLVGAVVALAAGGLALAALPSRPGGPDGGGRAAVPDGVRRTHAGVGHPRKESIMTHQSVGDVMTRDVVTVRTGATYKEIARLLLDNRVGGAPVVDERGRVRGVVSETDLLGKSTRAGDHGPTAFERYTRRGRRLWAKADAGGAVMLMTAPAVTIGPDAPLSDAARLMRLHHVNRLPVLDEAERLVGIVSRSDLLTPYLRPDADIRDEIVETVFRQEMSVNPLQFDVRVLGGVVSLMGRPESDEVADALVERVRAVGGVVEVVDRLHRRREIAASPGTPLF